MVLHHTAALHLQNRTTNTHCGAGTSQKLLCDRVNKAKGWLTASNCLRFLSASSLQLCSLNGSFSVWFLGFFSFTLWRWWSVWGRKSPQSPCVGVSWHLHMFHASGARALLAQDKLHLGVVAGECSKPLTSRCEWSFAAFVRYKNELFIYTAGLGTVQRGKSLLTKKLNKMKSVIFSPSLFSI